MKRSRSVRPSKRDKILRSLGIDGDQLRGLCLQILEAQGDDGAWAPDGTPQWSLVMTAVVVSSLKRFDVPDDTVWDSPRRSSGRGSLQDARAYLSGKLEAYSSGGTLGPDIWDVCRGLQAVHELGAKQFGSQVQWLEANWQELAEPDPSNRWYGPAFLSAMIDTLSLYGRGKSAIAGIRERLVFMLASKHPRGFDLKALGAGENEQRWNAGLLLRSMGERPKLYHDRLLTTKRDKIAGWLVEDVIRFGDWAGSSEAEGSMFLARSIEGLASVATDLGSKMRPRVDDAVHDANLKLQLAIEQRRPNLKAKTAILECWSVLLRKHSVAPRAEWVLPSNPSISAADRARANDEVALWKAANKAVATYVASRAQPAAGEKWYQQLFFKAELAGARVFAALPPAKALRCAASIVLDDGSEGYRYDRDHDAWHLGVRILLAYADAIPNPEDRKSAISLFMFHEYLHEYQKVTEATYGRVGSLHNVLDQVDYVADVYAIVHVVDMLHSRAPQSHKPDPTKLVLRLLSLMFSAFCAFEVPGRKEWPVRRLRRYMNWHWRFEQIRRASSLQEVMDLLADRPVIDIAGLAQRVLGQEVYVSFESRDPSKSLEVAVVLPDQSIYRCADSDATPMRKLFDGMNQRDPKLCQEFFHALHDVAIK